MEMKDLSINLNLTINLLPEKTLSDTMMIGEPRLAMLAGRPGMGKTAFALTLLKECQDEAVPVLYYSLKNSRDNLRMDRLERMGIKTNNKNISIVDRKDMSPEQFEELLSDKKPDKQYKLIVVDYLQLLQYGWEIKDLRNIAYKHKCFVLALAHLPRQAEMREDKHPVAEDIGHSEFDDLYFIYRDSYYEGWGEMPWDNYLENRLIIEQEPKSNKVELIIAKSKLLEIRTVPLIYDPKTLTLELL